MSFVETHQMPTSPVNVYVEAAHRMVMGGDHSDLEQLLYVARKDPNGGGTDCVRAVAGALFNPLADELVDPKLLAGLRESAQTHLDELK